MDDISLVVQALEAAESKRRESTILKLTPQALQDARVIAALQMIVETDPKDYAREAAHKALIKAGAIPDAPYVSPTVPASMYETTAFADIPMPPEVAKTLQDLAVEGDPHRERVVLDMTAEVRRDPRIIRTLHLIAINDPLEAVREAARKQLLAAGQTPAPSLVPMQPQKEGFVGIAALVGCLGVAICVPVFVIVTLAMLGPQIGEIFSRVTNGLGAP